MFENLRSALNAELEARKESTQFYIINGYFPTWSENNREHADDGLRRYSTPAKWNAYQTGTLARADAVKIATRRAFRDIQKTYAAKLEKLDQISSAPELEFISISLEWIRNRTWGNNPHANALTNESKVYTGTASGYGYDKASTAIAEALNSSPAVLKMLYTAAEKAMAEGQRPARINDTAVTWRNILGYGSGYSILPYFEGSVGVSCFETIFNRCGYTFYQVANSKRYDIYNVVKSEAN